MQLFLLFKIALAFQILICTSGAVIRAGHFKTLTGRKNSLEVYESTKSFIEVKCSLLCLQNDSCNSYNFNRHLSTCELSSTLDVADRLKTGEGIIDSVDVQDWKIGYRQLDEHFCSVTVPTMENPCSSAPCQNEAISCEPKLCNRDFQCTCLTGYSGKRCEIDECPGGFTLRFPSSCYKFVNNPETWLDAEAHCQMLDDRAHLVAIETEEEDNFLTDTARVSIWTGGTDKDNEGDWRWVGSSAAVHGDLWGVGEPNNMNGNEDCLVRYSNPKYVDTWCGNTYQFVCEVSV